LVDFVTGQPIVAVVGLKDHGHTWVLLVVIVVVEVHLTTGGKLFEADFVYVMTKRTL
jgi:hypothetical protein